MKIILFAYSARGGATMWEIGDFLEREGHSCKKYLPERLDRENTEAIPKDTRRFYGECFAEADALIFVGSCGIAVRHIAPFVKDKRKDPAVVVVDELGKHAIALLSGHIGGANRLTRFIAEKIGAEPVITTATDINGRFSADTWAAEHDYVIDSIFTAKKFSGKILEEDLPVTSDFNIKDPLPEGLYRGDKGEIGLYIGYRDIEPFDATLRLFAKVLHIGIGCRKGTPEEKIRYAVDLVMAENSLSWQAVADFASIDLKADEPGLLEFVKSKDKEIKFYTSDELSLVEGDFTPSEFVKSVTGVDNVCERAALAKANRLIVKKTAIDGVTVAVGLEKKEVKF